MHKIVTIPLEDFEEMVMFLNIYHLMHGEPSERFDKLIKKIEQYEINIKTGADPDMVVYSVPSQGI